MDGHNAGDDDKQQEFIEVFSEHSRRLYGFILTLTMSHADADEVYQSTSVVLWRKYREFDPDIGTFFAWACRIAHFEVLHLRRKNRRSPMLTDGAVEILHDELTRRSDDLAQREEALSHCLERLPAQDRRVIEERYHNSQAPKDIAKILGKSTHAVYRSLVRIHTSLRRCVSRRLSHEGL